MKLTLAIAAAFATVALSGPAVAGPAEDLAAKEKCNKCHTEKTTKKGPSWASIAEKYKGKADAEHKLFKHATTSPKVKVDGKEETHDSPKTKDEKEIRNLVRWILTR